MNVTDAFEALGSGLNDKIETLANILLSYDIWVWKKEAIEAHFGINKNDSARVSFLQKAKESGNINHAEIQQALLN